MNDLARHPHKRSIILVGLLLVLLSLAPFSLLLVVAKPQPDMGPATLLPVVASAGCELSESNLDRPDNWPIATLAYTPVPLPAVTPTPTAGSPPPTPQPVIGYSAQGRPIGFYRFGNGPVHIAVIGGIHGGYEGNTVRLVEGMIKYFQAYPEDVPITATLYIIPDLNPDGYTQGFTLTARFNGDGVDLNRNWDYEWQEYYDFLYGDTLYGGPYPFSEPETTALWSFIQEKGIGTAIFYHSQGGFISYPFEGGSSLQLAECFSQGTGYGVDYYDDQFDYWISGDAVDFLAANGLAAIDIELSTMEDPEWATQINGLLWALPCWLGQMPE